MRFIDEYRDEERAAEVVREITRATRGRWALMEVCGGQTHAILRFGLDRMLPDGIELLHGPGCPVCVTPAEAVDQAVEIALMTDAVLLSFGDMLRVPGNEMDLLSARARGADVRTVYSPLDAFKLAVELPHRQVVFFAVGFETTAPAVASAVYSAANARLMNFSVLSAHFLVPPALYAIMESVDCRVQAFLAPGHVCSVTGYRDYESFSAQWKLPVVVTGFEPLDILQGIMMAVKMLEEGRWGVENHYRRAVQRDGNLAALARMFDVFEVCDAVWRGIGVIPRSGLCIRQRYAQYDARARFGLKERLPAQGSACISGDILRGIKKPEQCPEFGVHCTPDRPLGAPMVSSEGACAAYYRYRRDASN